MPDQTTHTTTPEYSFWGTTFRFSSRVTDWPSNQANPEHTVDVRRPWVPSPYNRATDVEEGPSPRSTSTRSTPRSWRKLRTRRQAGDEEANPPTAATASHGATREHQIEQERERLLSWLSRLDPRKLLKRNWDATREHMDERLQRRDITPADWRAYGYWARPTLNNYGITVNNATPAENPRELSPPEVDAMLASLREPGGETHPENWVPRVRHPSLPPRPDLWPTPPQSPEPLPSEIQLNPWLVYRRMGALPLHFDLRFRATDIILGSPPLSDLHRELEGLRADFGCDGPNGSQPATYPGVPRLRIVGLANDPRPEFWWPFTVMPHHERLPVLVRDVFDAIIANFEEHITSTEILRLSDERRLMVFRAYARRTNLLVGGVTCPPDDGVRRVDYLGDNVCFRGLEPAPDGQGYILCLGPPA